MTSRFPNGIEGALRSGNLQDITSVNDFPDAVGGVITLQDNYTYHINGNIDLGGLRIQCGTNNAIVGTNAENCTLTSTLTNAALITASQSFKLDNIGLSVSGSGATVLDLDATGVSGAALDWAYVNFTGGAIGTITNYNNAIFNTLGIIGDVTDGFTFDGTTGTIGFVDTIFASSLASGNAYLTLPATATITRRFRLRYSAFVVPSGAEGIHVDAGATVPSEGYILDTLNFAGAGTYLAGISQSNDAARFSECRGIANTFANAYYTMRNNATATTIATIGVEAKVAGTTTLSANSLRFTHTNNRATYAGGLQRDFLVTVLATATSANNQEIGIYIGKNGTVIEDSEQYSTSNAAGRAEGLASQAIVSMSNGDYIEVFVENNTSTEDITVEQLNVIISAVGT